MNALKVANNIQPQLVQTLMMGSQAVTDQTMKQVGATMESKVALQEQAATKSAAASMTGIGTKIDTVA